MSADQTIGVTNQGSGSQVDVSEVTRPDGSLVERQRIVIGDSQGGDSITGKLASVRGEVGDQKAGLVVASYDLETLASIDETLQEILMLLRALVSA